MNPSKAKKKKLQPPPALSRKLLLVLLTFCVIVGYAGSAYLLTASRSTLQSSMSQQIEKQPDQNDEKDSRLDVAFLNRLNQSGSARFQGIRDLFRQTVTNNQEFVSLTFQGTLAGEQGAIAMINDIPVTTGTEVHGVQVVAISDQVLVLKYKGETKKLGVGETVSVAVE